jgi:hypothetical protein
MMRVSGPNTHNRCISRYRRRPAPNQNQNQNQRSEFTDAVGLESEFSRE